MCIALHVQMIVIGFEKLTKLSHQAYYLHFIGTANNYTLMHNAMSDLTTYVTGQLFYRVNFADPVKSHG